MENYGINNIKPQLAFMRHGIQGLLTVAMNGEFDIVLTEALDRLSCDQEDIAGIYKRMEFAGA